MKVNSFPQSTPVEFETRNLRDVRAYEFSLEEKSTEWVDPQMRPIEVDKKYLGQRKRSTLQENELSRSISQVREEHRRNLEEINKINQSVKYSARRSVQGAPDGLQQSSINSLEEVPLLYGEHCFSAKKKLHGEGSLSVTQIVALQNKSLDQYKASGCGSVKRISRMQSTEGGHHTESATRIDMLQQNLEKLAKLERRLMRGRGHRKKSLRPNAEDFLDPRVKEGQKKMKKKGKNWRFAYDLYCKEIINSNQQQLNSQRSQDRVNGDG